MSSSSTPTRARRCRCTARNRLAVPSGARDPAMIRALMRVEAIATRHDRELAEAEAMRAAGETETACDHSLTVFQLAVDTTLALEPLDFGTNVFVVERRRRVDFSHLEVFVELPLDMERVFAAHRQVEVACRAGFGHVLYGDDSMRARFYASQAVRIGPLERERASRRATSARAAPALRDWSPLAEKIRAAFAQGRLVNPLSLAIRGPRIEEDPVGARPSAPPSRVLFVHPDQSSVAALAALGEAIEV